MKPLSIRNALKLYYMIAPYLPETEEEISMEFIGKIIENIRTANKPREYMDMVSMMSGMPIEVIINKASSDEILQIFVNGFIDNKVLLLRNFCKKVGWNG